LRSIITIATGKEEENALVSRLFPLLRGEGVSSQHRPLGSSLAASHGRGFGDAAAAELSANIPDDGAAATTTTTAAASREAIRPGESYTIFHARDILGTLPKEFDTVLEHAARWVGVDAVFLGTVVEYFEWRIVAMERRYQRSRSRSRSRHASLGGMRRGRSTSTAAPTSLRHHRASSDNGRSRSRKATDDDDGDSDG
jgi:hypothetical protein